MFLRGKSYDKTAYRPYRSSHSGELGGRPADTGCNASATTTNHHRHSTAGNHLDAHSSGTDSEHCASSGESNDEPANEPDWAADAHHD